MKKNKVRNKVPKYEFGTLIDNPATDLYKNQIAMAKASSEAGNAWTTGLDIFGNLAQQVGSTMMNKGINNGEGADGKGLVGFLNKNNIDIQSGIGMLGAFNQFLAMGGIVPGTPVEVEGQEVGETPQGDLLNFQGPSHENGGIPISLPEGTEIYSKRIKVDGVSMADRKKKRERKTLTLEELFENNNTDALIKNSLNKTKQNNEIEENADNKIQEVVKQLLTPEGELTKHAWGDKVAPLDTTLQSQGLVPFINPLPSVNLSGLKPRYINGAPQPEANGVDFGNILGGLTLGDAIGLAGNLVSTFQPMQNTKANRAGDTPNINAFENYGQDGLETLDTSKQYINQIREQKLKDLNLARASSVRRNNNSARGINTQRALNLATDAQINNAEEETYNSFAESMLAILGQQAGMENQQDSIVMQGEAQKDLADRQDRDNYFTQLAEDIATKGTGLQETGKDINQLKQNEIAMNLLNQLSIYGITVDNKGNLSSKNKKK